MVGPDLAHTRYNVRSLQKLPFLPKTSLSSAPGAPRRPSRPCTTAGSDGRPRKAPPEGVVASYREFAGFVWAIATDQPLRNT